MSMTSRKKTCLDHLQNVCVLLLYALKRVHTCRQVDITPYICASGEKLP
jgi:hypothetical protein